MNAAQKKAARESAAKERKTPDQPQVPQTPAEPAAAAATSAPKSTAKKSVAKISPNLEGGVAADTAMDALFGKPHAHMQTGAAVDLVLTAADRARRADRIEALQEEILLSELETKRILLEMTQDQNQQYVQTKAQRLRTAKAAQKILNEAAWTQKQIEAGCQHATGGFGLDEIYEGDNKPSLVAMDLPIPGRKVILCYRCMKMVTTPDPNLRFIDADRWLEQTADYKEFLKLLRRSLSKAMSGPIFNFEQDGKPIHPEII